MGRRWRKHFAYFSIFLLLAQLFSFSAIVRANENVQSPVVNGYEVTFRYVGTGEEQSVLLVGSFNGWQTSGDKKIELTKESDRIWSVTKTLPDGKHMYKFVVDGNWKPDPLNNNQVDDGYGGKIASLLSVNLFNNNASSRSLGTYKMS